MKQIIFKIGSLNIYGYGLMIGLGILCAIFLLNARAKERGYDEDDIFKLTVITVISGVLGGKILYIITEFDTIIEDPIIIFKEFGNGFVIYGALIFASLAVYIYCRKKKWSILKVFDLLVPSVALAQGFGRIGCLLAGCCYGAETHSHFGIIFPKESLAPSGVLLYPTQIMSSVFDFLLAALLLWYGNKTNKDGKVFGLYFIVYSIGRFFIEFLRNDPRGNVWLFSTSQFIAIFTLIFGVVIFNLYKVKGRR